MRPKRSEAAPKGDLQEGLGEAVGADRQADHREVAAPGHAVGVHRKDRQDQEQAEHAQREDRRQRNAGAAFFGRLILSGRRKKPSNVLLRGEGQRGVY